MRLFEIARGWASILPEPLYSNVKSNLKIIRGMILQHNVTDLHDILSDLQTLQEIIINYLDSDEDLLDIVIECLEIILQK